MSLASLRELATQASRMIMGLGVLPAAKAARL